MSGIYFKGGKVYGVPQDGANEIFMAQNFEAATLSNFIHTGLVLEAVSPISGTTSAKLIHDSSVNQSFRETRSVSEKFRNTNLTVVVTAKSDANPGNVTISFYDETNLAPIQTTQQILADANVKTFQYGLKIPSNCTSFSYTITALPQSGSPVTYIDDITIKTYWQGTVNQGQTDIQIPEIIQQSAHISQLANIAQSNVVGPLTESHGVDIFTYNAGTGVYTVTKDAIFNISVTLRTSGANSVVPEIAINGSTVSQANTTAITAYKANTTFNGKILAGSTFVVANSSSNSSDYQWVSVSAQAISTTSIVTNDLVPAKSLDGSMSIDVPIITEWQSYALVVSNLSGFTAGPSGFWRRVGDSMEIRIEFTKNASAGSSGSVVSFSIPAGYTIDSTKLLAAGVTRTAGMASTYNVGGTGFDQSAVYINDNNTLALLDNGTGSSYVGTSYQASAQVSFTAKIPISGWESVETKTWSSTQSLIKQEPDCSYRLIGWTYRTASTSTNILYFNDGILAENVGNHINKVSSSVTGDYFEILEGGYYSVDFSGEFGSTAGYVSLQLNSTSITDQSTLATLYEAGSSFINNLSWSGPLKKGDILRLIRSGLASTNPTSGYVNILSITKVGTAKQIETVSDQKINLNCSEVSVSGSTARGSSSTGIVYFPTISNIRGDAFEVVSDSTNGTSIIIKKDGLVSIYASMSFSAAAHWAISLNQTNLTNNAYSLPSSEVLGFSTTSTANYSTVITLEKHLKTGDILRVSGTTNPSNNSGGSNYNAFSLVHKEQSVGVSVSNTLPQFSDSDSVVNVNGFNGYGSSATLVPRFSSVSQYFGKDIRYVPSAIDGDRFYAMTSGLYSISFYWILGGVGVRGQIQKNGVNILYSESTGAANNTASTITGQVWMDVGDYVSGRIISAPTPTGLGFMITKAGKPNVTGVNVTPFINIPQPISGDASWSGWNGNHGSGFQLFDTTTKMNGNGIFVADNTTGNGVKFLKRANVTVSFMRNSAVFSNSVIDITIYVDSTVVANNRAGNGGSGNTDGPTATYSGIVEAGQTIRFASSSNAPAYGDDYCKANILAIAFSDQILTESDVFSSENINLSYAPSSLYNSTTLTDAPIGTFITHTYTGSTNTRVQTTTAPSQSTSDMIVNGILVTPRAYGVTGSAATPAIFMIQVGKNFKGWSGKAYGGTGKTTELITKTGYVTGTNEYGVYENYDPKTGIYTIDAGMNLSGSTVTRYSGLNATTGASFANSYWFITASKNPALVGFDSYKSIACSYSTTSGQVVSTTTTTTPLIYETINFDTGAIYNTSTGIATIPTDGEYNITASFLLGAGSAVALTTAQYVDIYLYVNGVSASASRRNGTGGSQYWHLTLDRTLRLKAGDTLYISGYSSVSAPTYSANTVWNSLAITKL